MGRHCRIHHWVWHHNPIRWRINCNSLHISRRTERHADRTNRYLGKASSRFHAPAFFGVWFRGLLDTEAISAHRIGEAHNGYLEVLLGLGVVGLFLTTMFLLSGVRRAAPLLIGDYDWASLSVSFY